MKVIIKDKSLQVIKFKAIRAHSTMHLNKLDPS